MTENENREFYLWATDAPLPTSGALRASHESYKLRETFGGDDRLSRAATVLMRIGRSIEESQRDIAAYSAPFECSAMVIKNAQREAIEALAKFGYSPVDFLVEMRRRVSAKWLYFSCIDYVLPARYAGQADDRVWFEDNRDVEVDVYLLRAYTHFAPMWFRVRRMTLGKVVQQFGVTDEALDQLRHAMTSRQGYTLRPHMTSGHTVRVAPLEDDE